MRTPLSRTTTLYPLTILAWLALCLAAGLAPRSIAAPYFILVAGLAVPALFARIARPWLSRLLAVATPLIVSVILVQGLFWPGGTPVGPVLGPLVFKWEGLAFAAQMAGRVLLVTGAVLFLNLTVRPMQLATAITEAGAPRQLGYLALASLQLIPQLQRRASAVVDAQRARGLVTEGSPLRRIATLPSLFVPLVTASLLDAQERAMALDARGFGRPGPRTRWAVLPEAAWERPARSIMWWLAVGFVAVRLGAELVRLVGWKWPT